MTKVKKVENLPIREYFSYNDGKSMLKSNIDPIELEHLRTYSKTSTQDEEGWYNDVYYNKLTDSTGKILWGRELATIKKGKKIYHWSATSMNGKIRNNLFSGKCIDVDQVNSSPTISQALFKAFGLKCKKTDEYVNDRQGVFERWQKSIGNNITKDEIKTGINSLFGGSGKDGFLKGKLNIQEDLLSEYNEWKKNVTTNMKKILNNKTQSFLGISPYEIYEWKKKELIDTEQLDKNPLTSSWSILCQEIEGKITEKIIKFYTIVKFILNSKIYDGCHLRYPGKSIDEMIKLFNDHKEGCEKLLLDETDIPMKIAVKPMEKTTLVENEKLVDKDETYAGKRFIKLMGNNLKKECNKIYFFDVKTHLWEEHSKDLHIKYFNDLGNEMIFQQEDDSGKIRNINYSTIVRNIDNAFRVVNANLSNELFIQKGLDKAKELCIFNDVIVDFRTGVRKQFTECDSSYVFLRQKIPREYPIERDSKKEQEVFKKLFIDPFKLDDSCKDDVDKEKGNLEKTGQYFLDMISNAMMGNYRIKKFMFATGLSNSGKGILCEALKQAFGGCIGSFNGNSLMYSSSTADEAKKNSWMECLIGKKICFSNEASIEGKRTIDINQIKRIASGGDEIEYRKNFQDERSFINMTQCIFFSNEIPALSNPTDDGIVNRCVYIKYNRVFAVTMPYGYTEENSYYSQADIHLKDNLSKPEYQNAIFNIVLDNCKKIYKNINGKDTYTIIEPDSVSMEGKEIVASEVGEFKSDFWKCFERSELETDMLTIKNITRIFNEKFHICLTTAKVGLDMKKFLTDMKRKMIHNVVNITNIKIREEYKQQVIKEEPKQRLIPDDCLIDVSEPSN